MTFTRTTSHHTSGPFRPYRIRSAPSVVKFVMQVAMTIPGRMSLRLGIMVVLNRRLAPMAALLALTSGVAVSATSQASD
ncbi:MAG: hypothetical protein FJ095_21135 [Deltaproteobacteria bacterium]|nr:hypothetical protein [Deltaproteobacteria bacterium]